MIIRPAFLLVPALLLAGCSRMPTLPLGPLTPYRMDIQQGNFVTQDMIAKVRPGMTRSQVRFALGTPLIVDAFHRDRWDYVYFFQKAGTVTEQRRIVVIFEDDRLLRVEGDVVPAGAGSGTPPPAAAPAAPVSKPAAGEAQP